MAGAIPDWEFAVGEAPEAGVEHHVLYAPPDGFAAAGVQHPWNTGARILGVAEVVEELRAGAPAALPLLEDNEDFVREYGAGNARRIMHHYFAVDPLLSGFRMFKSDVFPFSGEFNNLMIAPCAYVFCHFRARAGNQKSPAYRLALAAGEAFSPKLPEALLGNIITSTRA